MCFGKSNSEKKNEKDQIPIAYRINRLDDPATPGHYYRTRTSIERHIATAPLPIPQPKGQRFPKPYKNREGQFPKDRGQLYEYPTKAYAYGALQNKDGNCRVPYTGHQVQFVEPEYTRTITTASKQVLGVNYHPAGDRQGHTRATEVYGKKKQRLEKGKHYDFPLRQDGQRVKVRV